MRDLTKIKKERKKRKRKKKMIQELLGGGAGLIGGERKISITGVLEGSSPSPSPSSSSPSPSSSAATTPASSSAPAENQNLRCPRCDSSNTKFCYYNNYNLTQPRHFCKTCRRYWTKGGALRNVPIGGGCRKNKTVSVTSSSGKPSGAAGRLKTVVSSEIGKSTLGLVSGFDQELPSNPILWASPQNSHLLALLRANQNPNPNSLTVKEESVMIGSPHMSARALGLNNQVPSIGLCNPFWRSNNQQQNHQAQVQHHHHHQQNHHQQQQQQQHNGFVLGEVQNTGIQDLYQRLRPSSVNYYPHHSPVLMSNVGSSSSSSSAILESAPVAAAGELDYWNPTLSWSDLPTTNGAYP
ncbi:unnamed protein product [Camellia sinensis]